ncbi:MAG: hypothetical protein QXS54_12010 [Candidatus Methanomethylicaceae archaeon]
MDIGVLEVIVFFIIAFPSSFVLSVRVLEWLEHLKIQKSQRRWGLSSIDGKRQTEDCDIL